CPPGPRPQRGELVGAAHPYLLGTPWPKFSRNTCPSVAPRTQLLYPTPDERSSLLPPRSSAATRGLILSSPNCFKRQRALPGDKSTIPGFGIGQSRRALYNRLCRL